MYIFTGSNTNASPPPTPPVIVIVTKRLAYLTNLPFKLGIGRWEERTPEQQESVNDGATAGMGAMVAGQQWPCACKQSPKEKVLVKVSKLSYKFVFCFFFFPLKDTFPWKTFQFSHDIQGSIFSLFWSRFRCLVHHWDAPWITVGNQVLLLMLNADVHELLGQEYFTSIKCFCPQVVWDKTNNYNLKALIKQMPFTYLLSLDYTK